MHTTGGTSKAGQGIQVGVRLRQRVGKRVRPSTQLDRVSYEPVSRDETDRAPQDALAAVRSRRAGRTAGSGEENAAMTMPAHLNAVQWDQAVGLARHACARIFRNGGTPVDAVKAMGLGAAAATLDWDRAIRSIAIHFCTPAR